MLHTFIRKQLKLYPLPVKVKIPVSQRLLEKYGRNIMLYSASNRGKLVLISITYPVKVDYIPLKQNSQNVKQHTISALPPSIIGVNLKKAVHHADRFS